MADRPGEVWQYRLSRRRLLVIGSRFAIAGAVVGTAGLAAACGRTSVRLGILGGTQPIWRYVAARNEALLKPLGYDARFEPYASEQELRDAFSKGQVDVIGTLMPQVLSLADAGLAVQIFAPIAWMKEGFPLVVPASSPVQSVRDLEGRRIGVFPVGHPGMPYWQAFLPSNYGLSLRDRFVSVESDTTEDLLTGGSVDAAFVDSVGLATLRARGGFRVVTDLSQEWRRRSSSSRLLLFGGYVARRDWIQAQQSFVEDFIRVNAEALRQYQTNRDAFLGVVSAYGRGTFFALGPEDNAAIAAYLGYDDVSPERVRVSNEDVTDYESIFPLLASVGYLRQPPARVADLFYLTK